MPAPADYGRRHLLITASLAFLTIGAFQAMYGPAFPALVERFDVGLERVGLTVSVHFAASFLAVVTSGLLVGRFGYRRVTTASALALAVGALVVAVAPAWETFLVGVFVGGLGFGLLDIVFNLLPPRIFGRNAAPVLNGVHAGYGVGSVVGPLMVGAAAGALPAPFGIVAATAVGLAVLALRLPEPRRPEASEGKRIAWLPAAGFITLFFLYLTSEAGVGAWETVHLEPHLGARNAAFATSAYWGALTLGRLLAITISARVPPRLLVTASAALALAALAAAHWTTAAPAAYFLVGLAFGPICPTTVTWPQHVFPGRAEAVAPMAVAAANLGPVMTTGAIGAAVAVHGPRIVPTLLTAIVAGLLMVILALWWGTRRA